MGRCSSAARAQHHQRQDQQRGQRPLPPGHERIAHPRREPPDRQPGRHQQHDQRGQQHALVALPQHGPDFLRVQQIDEVQAVRARVVFGDELRRGNFQQHVQHPPDAEPPGGRARGPGAVAEPRREHRGQRDHHGQQAHIDAQPADQQRGQAAGGLHAVPLPESQAQAAERQQRQHRQDESQGQAAHQAALRVAIEVRAEPSAPLYLIGKAMPSRRREMKTGQA